MRSTDGTGLILFSGDAVTSGTFCRAGGRSPGRMKASSASTHYGVTTTSRTASWSWPATGKGIVVLENKTTTVPVDGGSVVITGVTNVYRNQLSEETVDKLARERPPAALSIFLTHQPSTWLVRFAADREYDLCLGGHSRGGQIAFPLPGSCYPGGAFEKNT